MSNLKQMSDMMKTETASSTPMMQQRMETIEEITALRIQANHLEKETIVALESEIQQRIQMLESLGHIFSHNNKNVQTEISAPWGFDRKGNPYASQKAADSGARTKLAWERRRLATAWRTGNTQKKQEKK